MKKPLIICVDDEKIVLDSLKKELNIAFKDMLNVEIAESAIEALELINDSIKDGYEIPIIISDWLMPEMKGDELLIKVHSILPDTKKILLTGQATTEGVGNAVNNAKLYRYIAKPWQHEDLDLTVTEAFKLYFKEKKLVQQSKELLELNLSLEKKVKERTKELELSKIEIQEILNNTLKGSLSAIIQIVSKSNSKLFEKSIRIKDIIQSLIIKLELDSSWEFEIAAILSHIGCMNIDSGIVEKYFNNELLGNDENKIFLTHPQLTYEIINKIPHLEQVAEGILKMYSDDLADESFTSASTQNRISKLLKIAIDIDQLSQNGKNDEEIIEYLKKQDKEYDKHLINKAIEILDSSQIHQISLDKKAISMSGFKVGMITAESVLNLEGKVIIQADTEVTQSTLMYLVQVKKKSGIQEPIYVYNK